MTLDRCRKNFTTFRLFLDNKYVTADTGAWQVQHRPRNHTLLVYLWLCDNKT